MSKGGRPLTGTERKARYQIMLEPVDADELRRLGEGNLSRGVRYALEQAAGQRPISQKAAKARKAKRAKK